MEFGYTIEWLEANQYLTPGYLIGWVGAIGGLIVPCPQLRKLLKEKEAYKGVALWTYIILCFALMCYLIHAIYIWAIVFVVTQSINLLTNGTILAILIRRRGRTQ